MRKAREVLRSEHRLGSLSEWDSKNRSYYPQNGMQVDRR